MLIVVNASGAREWICILSWSLFHCHEETPEPWKLLQEKAFDLILLTVAEV